MSYSSLGITVESESTYVKLNAVQFSMNGSNNFSRGNMVVPFADYVDINYTTGCNQSPILTKGTLTTTPVHSDKANKRTGRRGIITTCICNKLCRTKSCATERRGINGFLYVIKAQASVLQEALLFRLILFSEIRRTKINCKRKIRKVESNNTGQYRAFAPERR